MLKNRIIADFDSPKGRERSPIPIEIGETEQNRAKEMMKPKRFFSNGQHGNGGIACRHVLSPTVAAASRKDGDLIHIEYIFDKWNA